MAWRWRMPGAMTEMSPARTVCAMKPETADLTGDKRLDLQMKQGIPPFGVEMKITDDANTALRGTARCSAGSRCAVRRCGKLLQGMGAEQFDAEGWFELRRRSPPSMPTATCKSPTGPRTLSSRAASGSPPSTWKTSPSATRCGRGGGDRHRASQVGRAAVVDHRAQKRSGADQGGDPCLHGWQNRQVWIPTMSCSCPRSAHGDRKIQKTTLREPIQDLSVRECLRCMSIFDHSAEDSWSQTRHRVGS